MLANPTNILNAAHEEGYIPTFGFLAMRSLQGLKDGQTLRTSASRWTRSFSLQLPLIFSLAYISMDVHDHMS